MANSSKYATVKKYWSLGVWDETRVRNAVVKGWITEEEFKAITGLDYE